MTLKTRITQLCFLMLRLWTTNPTKAGFYDKRCNECSTQFLHCPPFHLGNPRHLRNYFHPPLPSHIHHLTTWILLVMGRHTVCTLLYLHILIGHLGLPQHWRIQGNKYHSPVSLKFHSSINKEIMLGTGWVSCSCEILILSMTLKWRQVAYSTMIPAWTDHPPVRLIVLKSGPRYVSLKFYQISSWTSCFNFHFSISQTKEEVWLFDGKSLLSIKNGSQ